MALVFDVALMEIHAGRDEVDLIHHVFVCHIGRRVLVGFSSPPRPRRPPHDEMQIGALGDIHGEFDTVHLIMPRHADVPLWVAVGDVAANVGEYFAPLSHRST